MKTFMTLVCLAALALAAAPAHSQDPAYSQAELDQMLAPVALYPDAVLTHVLIAATYPVQVVQAARWTAENPGLEGDAALAASEDQQWDASVHALVAFPELLARMNEDLEWTQRVGDAFLAQESAVLDTVQQLRTRAYDTGNLRTSEKVRVVRETETIVIEPVVERVVYVPVYDTRVVYGPWWWSAHPPVYWGHHHHSVGLFWGSGYHVVPSFYHSRFHWTDHYVVVHGDRWHHRPRYHRPRHGYDRPRVRDLKPPPRGDAYDTRPTRTARATRSRPVTPAVRNVTPVRTTRPVVQARPTAQASRNDDRRTLRAPASVPRSAPSRAPVAARTYSAPAAAARAPSRPAAVSSRAPARAAPPMRATPAPAARTRPAAPARSAPARQQTSRPARRKQR